MYLEAVLTWFDAFAQRHNLSCSDHDLELLQISLTHKSYSADMPSQNIAHNERLEFLGDAILGMLVAQELYKDYPNEAESILTLKKIYLVKEPTLAQATRTIGAGDWLLFGKGEAKSGGKNKDAILADLFESLLAYIWLTFGYSAAHALILEYVYCYREDQEAIRGKSYKSLLQEYIQKRWQKLPVYKDEAVEVELSGNVLLYASTVFLDDQLLAEGRAQNKRKAQEEAAKDARKKLEEKG